MNINIVCNYESTYGGNFIPSLLFLCSSIDKNNKVIFTFPSKTKERNWANYILKQGYDVFYIDDFQGFKFKKAIKKINKKMNISIMYFHFISGLRAKFLYPLNKKVKLFIHVHSDFSGGNKQSLKQKIVLFLQRYLRRDAIYFYVSEDLYHKSLIPNKYYILNALCLNRIPCAKCDIDLIKTKNNIKSTDTIFLVFAWSPYVKGIDVVVKAFLNMELSKQVSSKLLIVHGKNDGYEKCVSFLLKNLESDGFLSNESIIFLSPTEDIFSLYNLADVFISSSRSEGFSYSLLEALYFNLYPLVSNISGTSWSKEFENVIFYETLDSKELSLQMGNLVGVKKNNMVNEIISNRYSIKNWSDILISLIFDKE